MNTEFKLDQKAMYFTRLPYGVNVFWRDLFGGRGHRFFFSQLRKGIKLLSGDRRYLMKEKALTKNRTRELLRSIFDRGWVHDLLDLSVIFVGLAIPVAITLLLIHFGYLKP